MIDKKLFKKSIAAPLERAGFLKKSQSWFLNGKDVVLVINLQKSDWNEAYYINIGIWLKALGDMAFPKENQCHLSYRAESLFPEQRELILLGCSLEKSNPQMLIDLSNFFENRLIPFLHECTDENKLRELMSQGMLTKGLVMKEARLYLSLGQN